MADLSKAEGRSKDVKQKGMDHLCKTEVEEGSSKDVKQKAQNQTYPFCFHFKNKPKVEVISDSSKTVIEVLNDSPFFVEEKLRNNSKEIIIRRSEGKVPRAAVKMDFPCCLIEQNDNLEITFIKNPTATKPIPAAHISLPHTDLVTFYVKTTGGTDIINLMKNDELRKTAEYVCVYALKGVEVETALKEDGRFIDKIFNEKKCLLVESESKLGEEINHEMSKKVEYVDGKKLQIIARAKGTGRQKKQTKVKSKSDVASAADSAQNDPGQHPNSTEQKIIQERETNLAGPSTIGHAALNTYGNVSGTSGNSFSTDIENFLKSLWEDVLKMLKQRENPQIQNFLQEEYDKGVQCFTEVNKVRQIMKLSDSVCLINVEDSAQGTGFLVFDRFILTNAHLVKDCVHSLPGHPQTIKLSKTLMAVFNYEVSGSEAKVLSVKDDVVAYAYETNDRLRFHDFALLELETAPDNCTELFERYKHVSPPNRGGIYIVGHPDGKVKKMDPCFIIGSETQAQSINKHISENVSCPYVTWQCWPYLHQNRITYNTCFFDGSSGSPVFDEHCCLIGMHSGGFDYKEVKETRSVIEFAYSMHSIIDAIVTQVKTRSDILKLLHKFKSIREYFDLGSLEDSCGANMSVNKEEQSEEVKEMEVDE